MIFKPKTLSTILKYVLLISIFIANAYIFSQILSENLLGCLIGSKGFLSYFLSLIFLILNNLIPLLVAIAFFTVGERKLLASMQRRTGPGKVGFWGSLQAIADGAKLVNKETLIPVKANFYLFLTAPMLALFLAFISWGFIPFSNISFFFDNDYAILVILGLSSINVYSVVLAGWSSNSKYTFLGGLRSCAQMISYEISISIILIPIFLSSNSLNFIKIVNHQENFWFIGPLFPLSIMFLISIVAETNRTPFDLPEAEAELVAGFNLEYSSIIFAFFFLAEYSNMILMSTIYSLLFLGGWLSPFGDFLGQSSFFWVTSKLIFVCMFFVHIRGNLPRYRYDQLMFIGWKVILPLSLAFVIFYISFLYSFDGVPIGAFDFYNFSIQLNPNIMNEFVYEDLFYSFRLFCLMDITNIFNNSN